MRRHGFSLVELSIVLVILGLLVGGILAGQSLIHAAELRTVTTETQRFTTALYAFRNKYMALPGDMPNATAFWTSLGGTGADATCQNISATGTPTCNGNGNGDIGTSAVTNDERLRAWQHLANAGLIEGQYTGIPGSGGAYHMIAGQNVPVARVSGGAYHIMTGHAGRAVADGPGSHFAGVWGLTDEIRASTSAGAYQPVFIPADLWNLDTKMDDGRPATGGVFTYRNQTDLPNCLLNDGAASTATYNLQAASKECIVLISILR